MNDSWHQTLHAKECNDVGLRSPVKVPVKVAERKEEWVLGECIQECPDRFDQCRLEYAGFDMRAPVVVSVVGCRRSFQECGKGVPVREVLLVHPERRQVTQAITGKDSVGVWAYFINNGAEKPENSII